MIYRHSLTSLIVAGLSSTAMCQSVLIPPSSVLPITPCDPPRPSPEACPGAGVRGGPGWWLLGTVYDYELDFKVTPIAKSVMKSGWFYGAACDCIRAPLGNPPPATCPPAGPKKTGLKSQICWTVGGSVGGTIKWDDGFILRLLSLLEVSVTGTADFHTTGCFEASSEYSVTPPQSLCFKHGARAVGEKRKIKATVSVAQSMSLWLCFPGGFPIGTGEVPAGTLRETTCNVSTAGISVDSEGERLDTQYTNYRCQGQAPCPGVWVPFTPENDGSFTEECCQGYLCPCRPPPPGQPLCCERTG